MVLLYLKVTGSFFPPLGGGFDFRYFSGSRATILQFFSSLTSSQSFECKYFSSSYFIYSNYLNIVTPLCNVQTFPIVTCEFVLLASTDEQGLNICSALIANIVIDSPVVASHG